MEQQFLEKRKLSELSNNSEQSVNIIIEKSPSDDEQYEQIFVKESVKLSKKEKNKLYMEEFEKAFHGLLDQLEVNYQNIKTLFTNKKILRRDIIKKQIFVI